MNIKDISKLINSLVPEIKAQVAEKMKFIGAENATFNLTVKVQTGDSFTFNLPPGTDFTKIATTKMTPEITDRIQQKTLEHLSEQQLQFASLSDLDATRFVVGSTLATMVVVVNDQVTVNEKVDVKITPSSTE